MTKEELKQEANLEASIMPWDEETDTWEDIAERAYIKGAETREKRIAELEAESAELKVDNAFYKKACEGATMMYKDLQKAKKLLERLLITSCNSDVLNLLPNCSEVLRVRVEAEQFLSEVVK